ncbi:hypothetical protein QL285_056828 [Trifolium repens]|jgi:hypothetical protein|nr:hypothetical protein QL285_056828 [Trifolium repens]
MTDKVGRQRGGKESVAHSSARREYATEAEIPRKGKGKKGVGSSRDAQLELAQDIGSEAQLEPAHDIGSEAQHVNEVEAEYEARHVDEVEAEIQQYVDENEVEQSPPPPK